MSGAPRSCASVTGAAPIPRLELRKARLDAGLTLDKAAKQAGYAGRSGWSNIESGRYVPSLEQMRRMSEVVGRNPVDLFPEFATAVAVEEQPESRAEVSVSNSGCAVETVTTDGVPWFLIRNHRDIRHAVGQTLSPGYGCVYALQCAQAIKIGSTSDPIARRSHIDQEYGEWGTAGGLTLLSPPHANYGANERILHDLFAGYRIKTEFFNLSLIEFVAKVRGLKFYEPAQAVTGGTTN